MIGALGFTAPWVLLGLAALPILWILLRALPPAPIRRIFPGVGLLLGLKDETQVSAHTPWWLIALRALALAALIIGLAGPVLNPKEAEPGRGPLLIMVDASWASARDWPARRAVLGRVVQEARSMSRPVALLNLSAPAPFVFQTAEAVQAELPGLVPSAWEPQMSPPELEALLPEGAFDTVWLSDQLQRDARAEMARVLSRRGALRIIESDQPRIALASASFEGGQVTLDLRRSFGGARETHDIAVHGTAPNGAPQVVARVPVSFEVEATAAQAKIELPAELRARVRFFAIDGVRSAGAIAVSDDSLQQREVALIAGRADREGLELLSPLHYLRQALAPNAKLIEGALSDVLPAAPDVIILADLAQLAPSDEADLIGWVEAGGLLVRFAGPQLAASDVSRAEEDPLMPVRLRSGGRRLGGAMSWGTPKALAPFPENSPFFGLPLAPDVTVSSQVMAQPDPVLAKRVIARLKDGTPLVTRKALGAGQVVLFHVSANAEWSNLALSGLFVDMLNRLAVSTISATPAPAELAGTIWKPLQVMDGFGRLRSASDLPGVAGEALFTAPLGPEMQPGLYGHEARRLARNVIDRERVLTPARWPAGTEIRPFVLAQEVPFGGLLLCLALALLLLDSLVTLAFSGRLHRALAALLCAALVPALPIEAQEAGQDDRSALRATSELTLAHVVTGDRQVDETALAGLRGLSETLFFRTSVEPSAPVGVDLERDEIAFFPLLYWPITPRQSALSDQAYARLNAYLRAGGMILFDTRDADIARFGASSPNGRKLQELAQPLEIPPLEPLPDDHVLTRTFYLLQEFPGRHQARDLWVEAAPLSAERAEGMPFRNLNDGVSPVVIGGNDWASAWARDTQGHALYPIGRGYSGERQRELAYRFGVNLVMHVLTGNYKSDQVHVPALLERLGQ